MLVTCISYGHAGPGCLICCKFCAASYPRSSIYLCPASPQPPVKWTKSEPEIQLTSQASLPEIAVALPLERERCSYISCINFIELFGPLASLFQAFNYLERSLEKDEQNIRAEALLFSGLSAIFLLAVFRAVPRLNKQLEEASPRAWCPGLYLQIVRSLSTLQMWFSRPSLSTVLRVVRYCVVFSSGKALSSSSSEFKCSYSVCSSSSMYGSSLLLFAMFSDVLDTAKTLFH